MVSAWRTNVSAVWWCKSWRCGRTCWCFFAHSATALRRRVLPLAAGDPPLGILQRPLNDEMDTMFIPLVRMCLFHASAI
jgi:hypothetical protein